MEVGRQITVYLIVCFCTYTIYTKELGVGNDPTLMIPNEEFSNRTELRTGNISGKITTHKDGAKLIFKIESLVNWKNEKWLEQCIDSKPNAGAGKQQGEKGDKGDDGSPGIKGEKGEKGDKGDDGLPGTKGEQGEKGDKGDAGLPGIKGEQGEKGDKGDAGLPGIKGEQGEKGDKGDAGLPGIKGEQGEKGDKGDAGLPGIKGEQGEKGDKGNDGLPGTEGAKGEKGDKGDAGLPGIKGEQGEKGDKGNDGLPGTEGAKGEKGDKGDAGLPGIKGEQGEPGVCDVSSGEKTTVVDGSRDHPLHSCIQMAGEGERFIKEVVPFNVRCEDYRTCILKPSKVQSSFKPEEARNVWLSNREFTLKKFYGLNFVNLSYLVAISESFILKMKYNSEVTKLKILSWTTKEYDIKFDTPWKSCEFISTPTTEGKYIEVTLTCPQSNYLPKDFYVEVSSNEVSIELISLCFK